MTEDEDLHDEAETIRAETAADAPELAEHDRVAELERELEEAKAKVLYAAADTQNVRRRLETEKAQASAYAVTGFARDMLAVRDHLARALDHVGVITVEFFACGEGPVVNEIAPRVHNSGHWTIEGAATSQFEQHLRAICGLPLGDTALVTSMASMDNLIGGDVGRWAELIAEPGARVHLYGKGEARPGRKMGHVTRLG